MTSKMIIGNLKMHACGEIVKKYRGIIKDHKFGLLLPYPYLMQGLKDFKDSGVWIGAQGVSEHKEGAYSSQVSASILKDIGVGTVMIGHAETRALGVDVKAQIERADELGLRIIYCVGEGQGEDREVVLKEQMACLRGDCIVAYEPIWCIGSGKVPENEDINQAVSVIKGALAINSSGNMNAIKVLYGGSVDNNNCEAILSHTDIDGFLVGGISLNPEKMLEVVERCK